MTATLKKLLPLHDLRERRALRQFQDDSRAHEMALTDEMRAKAVVLNLRNESAQATQRALLPDISAAQALAGFEYAGVLASQAVAANKELEILIEASAQALEKLRLSRVGYIHRVRVNRTIQQASQRQSQSETSSLASAQEQRADDEFVPVWLAQRQTASGVAV